MLFWKRIPSARSTFRRLLALKAAVVHALASPLRDILEERMANWSEDENAKFMDKAAEGQREFIQRVKQGGVWRYLTPSEKAFLNTSIADMTSRQQMDFSWRAEATHALMWALHIVPELPAQADDDAPTGMEIVVKNPYFRRSDDENAYKRDEKCPSGRLAGAVRFVGRVVHPRAAPAPFSASTWGRSSRVRLSGPPTSDAPYAFGLAERGESSSWPWTFSEARRPPVSTTASYASVRTA